MCIRNRMPYRTTRRSKKSRRQRKSRKMQRRRQRQGGGGFSYDIPPNAIVEHRDMNDSGTNPPRLMTKRAMDEMISDSERA
jgi:hypothetical protein